MGPGIRRRGLLRPAILAVSLLPACGGDPGTGPGSDPTAAASITVSPGRVHLMPGLTWTATAQALSSDGRATTRPITWSSSDPGVATVDPEGLVSGVASGIATVTARVDEVSGSVDVTVVDEVAALPLTVEPALEVTPGVAWSLRGQGLAADLTVTIDGIPAPVTASGDTLSTIVPALEAFGRPCLPPYVPVTFRTSESVIVASAPAAAPFPVDAAAGARQNLDAAVLHECAIEIPQGDYLLAAVVVDRASAMQAGALVPDSVTLSVWSGAPDAAAGPGNADMVATGALLPTDRPARDLLPGPSVPAAPTTESADAHAACTTIIEIGDSILVPTGRDAEGRYDWNGAYQDEWWHLVEQTPHLDLLVDSAAAHVWDTDPYVREEVRAVMALYETEWVPIWRELYEDELPDMDGNGRMIMRSAWNSAVGGGGGIGVYRQADCDSGWRPGEDFYVPMDIYSDDPERAPEYLRAFHRVVAQHEASHTHDLARRFQRWGDHHLWYTSQVAAEGIASFATAYWLLKKAGDPLLGNHDRPSTSVEIEGLTYEPGGWAIHPDISNTYEWSAWAATDGYPQALQFVTWAAAHAVREGNPISTVLTRLAYASSELATYGSIFRDATATRTEDAEVLARWGFSWLVDDRVEGVEPQLTIPTWNTAAVYRAEPAPPPLPSAVVDQPGRVGIELGEPDIALVKLVANGADRFGIDMDDRGAGPRLHVQILRTK